MKKAFMILATVAVAAMSFTACNKDGKEEKGKDTPDEPEVPVFEVAIDGNFSDWDALTAETATENDACIFLEAGAEAKNLKALKATSDEENVYLYCEIAVDKVQSSDKAIEGGNSNDGHGDDTPGPLTIYWDLDNNAATGFTTHQVDGEPVIAGMGLELGTELYLFIDSKDGKCKLGWAQVVEEPAAGPDGGPEDGDDYQTSWWGKGYTPDGGWTPDNDNLTPRLENYKTAVGGGVVKIEWSVERSLIASYTKRGHDMGDTIVIGANYFNNDSGASYVKGAGLLGPITIKLR